MSAPPRWLVCSLLTLLFWGGWGIAGKVLGDSLSPEQSLAFSTLGLLPLMAALALRRHNLRGQRWRRGVAYAFAAGILAGLGNLAYFEALAAGGSASTVTPLTALYPMVTIILAMLFLKERLSRVQLLGIALALASIYFFNPVADGKAAASAWLGFALLPIALWGLSAFVQKLSTSAVSSELCTLAFWAAFLPLSAAIMILCPMEWTLPPRTWLWVLLLGALFGLGNLTLLAAYAQDGKASIVTPLSGLYSLVTVPAAMVFLGEKLTHQEAAAIVLALLAVVALAWERAA